MGKTAIEWTRGEDGSAGATWNPVAGCSVLSPGCINCYAMRMAARLQKMNRTGGSNSNYVNHYDGTTQQTKSGPVWTGKVVMAPENILHAPLSWKKPRRVFVNSMSDLFHESIPDEWIDRVLAVMALCPQHTFQCLTKRAERMLAYCSTIQKNGRWLAMEDIALRLGYEPRGRHNHGFDWLSHKEFLPNCWLGVSAERQQEADERIPLLLQTPAAVRFVSAEPLLSAIDLEKMPFQDGGVRHRWSALTGQALMYGEGINGQPDVTIRIDKPIRNKLDLVIVGGESGPNARPMHPQWARSLHNQCAAAKVPFFFKQWGEFGCVADHGFGGHEKRECITLHDPYATSMIRIGKKRAGRMLDGREHNEMPARTA